MDDVTSPDSDAVKQKAFEDGYDQALIEAIESMLSPFDSEKAIAILRKCTQFFAMRRDNVS